MSKFYQNCQNETEELNNKYLNRSLPEFNEGKYVSFNSNDYFNLSCHPKVTESFIEACRNNNLGERSSRLIGGNNIYYRKLENRLAEFKHSEKSLVLGSGYLANIGVISALAKKNDLILSDKLIHSSLIDGIKLSGAKHLRFPHNNIEICYKKLKKYRKLYSNCFIITETVFSMDGDLAPIDELYKLAEKFDAILISDDAHGLGFKAESDQSKAHIQLGTLSKAVGSYGGYVCCNKIIYDYLVNKCRTLIYSTALPLPVIAASLTALELIINHPDWGKNIIDKAAYLAGLLNISSHPSPIISYIINDNQKTLNMAAYLKSKNILISAIRSPTVPSSRLRISILLNHSYKELEDLSKLIKDY